MTTRRTAAVVAILIALAAPASGWSRAGHALITEEAVERLPEPLQGRFAQESALGRLKDASIAPDDWGKKGSDHSGSDERPRHFLRQSELVNLQVGSGREHGSATEQRARAEAQFAR